MPGNDANTVSLLHLDGTDASTIITDEAVGGTHTWTANGNAQLDTADKKFGSASLLLDGDGDYVDTPDSADFDVGSGDFTVDFQMKRGKKTSHEMILGQADSGGSNSSCAVTIYMMSAPYDKDAGTDFYTKSLLHFDGDDTSTEILESACWRGGDAFGKPWTCQNHAQQKVAAFKFGSASLYCDGTDDYIDRDDYSDLTLSSGNFTVECWIKRGRTSTLERITGQMAAGGQTTSVSFGFRFNADDTILFNVGNGGSLIFTSTVTEVSDTNWHHLAMVRNGNTVTMYIDGTADANTLNVTGITINDSATKLAIGRIGEFADGYFQGYVDEYRISKGVARYTGNFTPSTTGFYYDRILAGFCYGALGKNVQAITDISEITTWHHVAMVRNGNDLLLFLDGILQGTTDVTGITVNNSTNKFAVGREGEAVIYPYKGWIDEFRFSKGLARWTENFTPPTTAYSVVEEEHSGVAVISGGGTLVCVGVGVYEGYESSKFGYINNPYWTEEPASDHVHFPCGYFFKRRET